MTNRPTPSQSRPPKWREDFPYESSGDDFVSRRDFVRFLTVVSGGLMLGNGIIMARAVTWKEDRPTELDVCVSIDLKPASSKVFSYPADGPPALLIRRSDGSLLAYQQRCTHLACPVDYTPPSSEQPEKLVCHCHKGVFDLASGRGTHGPPRELRPLRRVLVREDDGRIVAHGLGPATG